MALKDISSGTLAMDVATYIQNRKRKELAELESRYGVSITLNGDPSQSPGGGELDFIKENGTTEKRSNI